MVRAKDADTAARDSNWRTRMPATATSPPTPATCPQELLLSDSSNSKIQTHSIEKLGFGNGAASAVFGMGLPTPNTTRGSTRRTPNNATVHIPISSPSVELLVSTNTLQHATTHCNTLQHTAAHFSILQHTAAQYSTSDLYHRHTAATFKYSLLVIGATLRECQKKKEQACAHIFTHILKRTHAPQRTILSLSYLDPSTQTEKVT